MDNKRGDFRSPLTHFSFNSPQMYNILSVLQDIKKPEAVLRVFVVGLLGLEPRMSVPKTEVLPLHHRPLMCKRLQI